MKTEEIVRALRCTSSVHTEEIDCSGCPYRTVEKLEGEDAALFGDVFVSCEIDKIAMDAADALEELTKEEYKC